nr:MAG TPA: hypothetical protein [Caudoviricetes sp.]DAJ10698.1 MAG TPA: hypothetical protein [Caudoviricetes sp.]DAK68348.1 MAG TPA: hypothetical protein [Crassvirales sp.]
MLLPLRSENRQYSEISKAMVDAHVIYVGISL